MDTNEPLPPALGVEGEDNRWNISIPTGDPRYVFVGSHDFAVLFVRRKTAAVEEFCEAYAKILVPSGASSCEVVLRSESDAMPQSKRLSGRQVGFIASNVPHSCHWAGDGDVFTLCIRPECLRRMLDIGDKLSGGVVGEFALAAVKAPIIWGMTFLCRRLCEENDQSERDLVLRLGRSLGKRLLKTHFGTNGKVVPMLNDEQLEKVMDFFEANLQRVPSNSELAHLLSISPEYFARLFKNTTGETVGSYRNSCRMRIASEMLDSGKHRINEVAHAIGFGTNVSYFSRWFKRNFEAPPSAYARKSRQEVCKKM